MLVEKIQVDSPSVTYGPEYIESTYQYDNTKLEAKDDGSFTVTPLRETYQLRTKRAVPKLG